jgi:hypothetical protein
MPHISQTSLGKSAVAGAEMNKRIKVVSVFIVLITTVLFAWVFYHEHTRIAARIWQVRHKGVLVFDGYSIPVPVNWYVQDRGPDSEEMRRMDSASGRAGHSWNLHTTMTLTGEAPLTEIDKWTSLVASSFRLTGTDPEFRKMVSGDGEIFSCVGGEVLPSPPGISNPVPVAWHCRSTGRLEILLVAAREDMSQNWEILSRIRRTSQAGGR